MNGVSVVGSIKFPDASENKIYENLQKLKKEKLYFPNLQRDINAQSKLPAYPYHRSESTAFNSTRHLGYYVYVYYDLLLEIQNWSKEFHTELLSIEWNPIRLGGPVHGIVIKTVLE